MTQLTYSSTARRPFTTSELKLLLLKARMVNATKEVTGILFYHKGFFFQLLEGTDPSVDDIFSSIQRDPRHHKIKVLSRETEVNREFDGWSMRFVDTGAWDLKEGLVGYNILPQFVAADSTARRYLRLFHLGLFRDVTLPSESVFQKK